MRKIPDKKRHGRGGLVGVSTVMMSALGKIGENGPDLQACARLTSVWTAVVGANLAHHLRPVKVTRHVLLIEASSNGWLSEARFLEEAMLANIRREVPKVTIEKLQFRLAKRAWAGTGDAAGEKPQPSLGAELAAIELSPETESEIDETVSHLAEGPLRESARRAFQLAKKAEILRGRKQKESN